jgi:hypothetical protein
MKKLLLIAFLGMSFIFLTTGCKKETTQKNTDDNSISIVGKWNYKNDVVSIYTKSKLTGGGPYTYSNGEYIQFNNNGTGRDQNTTFTYTVKNKEITISYAAYTKGGDTYDADVSTAAITELSDNKLTLYYDSTFKDSDNLLNGNEVTEYLVR